MARISGRERQRQIRHYLENTGRATTSELSGNWNVTEETIRRDLDKLEAQGLVTRIHGGVIWNVNRRTENIHFYERQRNNIQEKRVIAEKAKTLLQNSSPLFGDSSTTVVEAMKALKDEPNLTVVTNSSELFAEIKTWKFGVICTGGIYNEKSMSFQGEMAKNAFQSYNARLAVISCKGLRLDGGIYDSYESEAEIKRVMLENAEKVALLVDHTKFDDNGFLRLTDIDQIDYLVTDRKPADEWMDFCAEHEVKVIY
jgi:DeoR/GlpR family transcriptional regulator of sugar metabolism